jgi:chromosomal replication initiator protein
MLLIEKILTQTAEVFARTPAELIGRSRKRPIVEARQAALWAVRQRYPSLSLETIGTAVGGRHYSTVMHALSAVEQRAARQVEYRVQLQHVMERVASRSERTAY